jgi:hypothetical protein
MEATAAASMAARDVGSSTPRLKAGDSVSIESTHFDAPGRPGSYSASTPARAFGGVVLGRTRANGCFNVRWRGGDHPMESHRKHLRLEPEDASVPKQQEGETAPAFRRRAERHVVEADRKAKADAAKRQKEDEVKRKKRFEERVRKHDAATPPEQREGESNNCFKQRERRFRNRVRPTLPDGPGYHRHRHAAVAAGAAAPRALPTQEPLDDFFCVALPAEADWSHQHERDAAKATLLFHHTTGLLAESEDDFTALLDPTDAALEACVTNFTAAVSVDVPRVGCAGCGVVSKNDGGMTRSFNGNFKSVVDSGGGFISEIAVRKFWK